MPMRTHSGLKFAIIVFIFALTCCEACQYSCSSCIGNLYTQCLSCQNNVPLNVLPVTSMINLQSTGLCEPVLYQQPNALGIILLLVCIVLCIILKNQQAFYLTLAIQSIALLGLVEINWGFPTEFVLDAFEYLMMLSKIGQTYKKYDGVLISNNLYKADSLFHTTDYYSNMSLLGYVNIFIALLLVLLPIIKAIRKKTLDKDHFTISDSSFDKITSVMMVIFLFSMQQMTLIIFLTYKYGPIGSGLFVSSIFYFIFYIYFFISVIFKPFLFFRNKLTQGVVIIRKFIQPIFIILGPDNQFILFILLLFFDLFEIAFTWRRKNLHTFNRILVYRLIELVATVLFLFQYIIVTQINNFTAAHATGIISLLGLCLFIYPLVTESIILAGEIMDKKAIDEENSQSEGAEQNKKVNAEITEIEIGLNQSEDAGNNYKKHLQDKRQQERFKQINVFLQEAIQRVEGNSDKKIKKNSFKKQQQMQMKRSQKKQGNSENSGQMKRSLEIQKKEEITQYNLINQYPKIQIKASTILIQSSGQKQLENLSSVSIQPSYLSQNEVKKKEERTNKRRKRISQK